MLLYAASVSFQGRPNLCMHLLCIQWNWTAQVLRMDAKRDRPNSKLNITMPAKGRINGCPALDVFE